GPRERPGCEGIREVCPGGNDRGLVTAHTRSGNLPGLCVDHLGRVVAGRAANAGDRVPLRAKVRGDVGTDGGGSTKDPHALRGPRKERCKSGGDLRVRSVADGAGCQEDGSAELTGEVVASQG